MPFQAPQTISRISFTILKILKKTGNIRMVRARIMKTREVFHDRLPLGFKHEKRILGGMELPIPYGCELWDPEAIFLETWVPFACKSRTPKFLNGRINLCRLFFP